jgi:hypothetical protein
MDNSESVAVINKNAKDELYDDIDNVIGEYIYFNNKKFRII